MDSSDQPFKHKAISYADIQLLIFNSIGLIFGIILFGGGIINLSSENEIWGFIRIYFYGNILISIQILLLLPFTILSLIRKKSNPKARTILVLLWLAGMLSSIASKACLYYEPLKAQKEHKEQFETNITEDSKNLYKAIESNDKEGINILLTKNKDLIWERNLHGDSPLIFAVKQRKPEMVNHLLIWGTDIMDSDYSGKTPLHWAVNVASEEIIEILLKKAAPINQGDNWGKTPLELAKEKSNERIIQLLERYGAKIYDSKALIIEAVEQGKYETVKNLLAQGIDVNTRVPNGCCLIHFAAENGRIEVAKLLLEKGANVNNISPSSKLTPLHEAASGGQLEMAKFLVSKRANLNLKNYYGETPAELAKKFGHNELADYLNSINKSEDNK